MTKIYVENIKRKKKKTQERRTKIFESKMLEKEIKKE